MSLFSRCFFNGHFSQALVALAVCSLLFSPLSFTQAMTDSKPHKFVLCKFKDNVRSIYIEKGESECQTIYTKYGSTRTIGTAKTLNSCQAFLENVQGNLEEANWKCGAKNATISEDFIDSSSPE